MSRTQHALAFVVTPVVPLVVTLVSAAACSTPAPAPEPLQPAEVRAIAAEAYVWGYPLVDNYRVQHAYFVQRDNPEYRGAWNTVHSSARVFTPEDRAVQTPNSDTPYSMLGLDLRGEPIVVSLPEVEAGRYVSVQFIDAYTFNFAYLGTRATGNGAGSYLVAGPGWRGETPSGVAAVIRCETAFAIGIFRTQLFAPEDLAAVQAVQAGFRAEPLSAFLGRPAPPAPPALEFIAPLSPDDQKSSPRFFEVLDFVLRHCPEHAQDQKVRARLARLGVGGDAPFDIDALPHELHAALAAGIADAWVEYARHAASDSTLATFGAREVLAGDWLRRMSGTVRGIYGNSREEAIYVGYTADAEGAPLDGTRNYTLRFAADALPPVAAFWSLTMYEMPESLLYANPLERYLINSAMLPALARDADGGLTLHVQHTSPGAEREANWLPAPSGPFTCVMRLYLPQPEALDGRWQAPTLVRAP